MAGVDEKDIELIKKDREICKKESDGRIKHVFSLLIGKIALLNQRLDEGDKELSKQATEYERRLADLGRELNQLKITQSDYLKKDTYDLAHLRLSDKVDILQRIVFIGLGLALALQFIIEFLFKK